MTEPDGMISYADWLEHQVEAAEQGLIVICGPPVADPVHSQHEADLQARLDDLQNHQLDLAR